MPPGRKPWKAPQSPGHSTHLCASLHLLGLCCLPAAHMLHGSFSAKHDTEEGGTKERQGGRRQKLDLEARARTSQGGSRQRRRVFNAASTVWSDHPCRRSRSQEHGPRRRAQRDRTVIRCTVRDQTALPVTTAAFQKDQCCCWDAPTADRHGQVLSEPQGNNPHAPLTQEGERFFNSPRVKPAPREAEFTPVTRVCKTQVTAAATYQRRAILMGVVRHDVNRSAGRSGIMGRSSLASQAAS